MHLRAALGPELEFTKGIRALPRYSAAPEMSLTSRSVAAVLARSAKVGGGGGAAWGGAFFAPQARAPGQLKASKTASRRSTTFRRVRDIARVAEDLV